MHEYIRMLLPVLRVVDRCFSKAEWMARGPHGKPYANWTFPGSACPYAIGANGLSPVDKAMLDGVSSWFPVSWQIHWIGSSRAGGGSPMSICRGIWRRGRTRRPPGFGLGGSPALLDDHRVKMRGWMNWSLRLVIAAVLLSCRILPIY